LAAPPGKAAAICRTMAEIFVEDLGQILHVPVTHGDSQLDRVLLLLSRGGQPVSRDLLPNPWQRRNSLLPVYPWPRLESGNYRRAPG
jgi:hypothetical protein